MARFILLSFGFLGWAFYELSGGADFDAEALRISRMDAPIQTPAAGGAPTTLLAEVDTTGAEALDVTRVALNLTTTRDVAAPEKTLRTQPARLLAETDKIARVLPQDTSSEGATPTFAGATLSTASLNADKEANPSIILPSLVTGTTPVAALPDDTPGDIRTVSGTRVNVRGGPGTSFSVVGQLTRGAEVEILRDNGDGWVELRSLDGAALGWMADFLLSDG